MNLLVEQAPPLRPYQVAAVEQIKRAYIARRGAWSPRSRAS